MPFDSGVNPPSPASYAPPNMASWLSSFLSDSIGNLPNDYYQGKFNNQQGQINQQRIQQQQQQLDLAKTFAGGIPTDAQGNPDYRAITAMLAQKGDINAIEQLAPYALAQQPGQVSPLFGGPYGGPGGAPGAAPAPRPQAATPATFPGGDAGTGTITDLVTAKLPQNSVQTGQTIARIAQTLGIDPNAPLTPGQQRRVQGLVDRYTQSTTAPTTADAAPTQPLSRPVVGTPQPGSPPAVGTPNAKVTDAFAGLPPSAAAVLPAPQRTEAPTQNAAAAAPAAPAAAPAQNAPLVPQPPLPTNPQTGKKFTDPQEAITALRTEAMRMAMSPNPQNRVQTKYLSEWADQIEAAQKPVTVGQSSTVLDPRTGKVLYQGPAAAAYSTGGGETGSTLDADAERYRQTGTLPPNMGRGIQGQQQATAIRTRAVEQEVNAGGDPNQWPQRWQEFKAKGTGLSAEARVGATREANLKIILRAADAAVPAAIEQSEKVWRSEFVPLNKIIQRGQLMTSDPELGAFGMANLQLAEHWARAMNPTGVMRESDRDKALEFLSTATSQATYKRLVQQLQKQIQRELTAVQAGKPSSTVPEPGVLSAEQKETSQSENKWTTLPSGVRIREVQ